MKLNKQGFELSYSSPHFRRKCMGYVNCFNAKIITFTKFEANPTDDVAGVLK